MNIPNLFRIAGQRTLKLRRPVPSDWVSVDNNIGAHAWQHPNGLRVVISLDELDRDELWLHLSVSRSDRLPSWEDLKFVKDALIGRNHEAIQVLPKDSEYVNIHRFCLHLWSREEGGGAP